MATALMDYADAAAHGTDAARSFIHDREGVVASLARVALQIGSTINMLRLYQTDTAKDTLSAIAANGAMPAFADAVGLDKLKAGIVGFIAEIQQIPNTSDQAAVSIEALFGSIPDYTVEANEGLIKFLQTISATGRRSRRERAKDRGRLEG